MGTFGQIAGGESTNAVTKKKQKEEDPVSSTSSSDSVPGAVSGFVGGGMNRIININVEAGTSVQ